MKTITVITTTYNRAQCLHRVYESLCRQTCDDFVWLVVDDGSSDSTKSLVQQWICEGKIIIEYLYKENGGMHTARNLAYENVKTEINVIIDSDDWMTDDGVEKIVTFWKENKSKEYYGIIANNMAACDGSLIGTPLPDISHSTLTDLYGKHGVKGDKKIILRSDLARLYPFPEFTGEKFYPASYKYRLLDLDYELLIMDSSVCVVDYNEDSMTYNKYAQYKSCSKGFAHYRNEMIRISHDPKQNLKNTIHYIAESKLAKNKQYIKNCSKPIYPVILFFIGQAYYFYLKKTSRKY